MTEAKDCCFVAADGTMRINEALSLLRERLKPVTGFETVPLRQALMRVLAGDVVAGRDVPPHDNSAMDGYAVFFDKIGAGGDRSYQRTYHPARRRDSLPRDPGFRLARISGRGARGRAGKQHGQNKNHDSNFRSGLFDRRQRWSRFLGHSNPSYWDLRTLGSGGHHPGYRL